MDSRIFFSSTKVLLSIILHLKKSFVLISILLIPLFISAQVWQTVGSKGFSDGNTRYQSLAIHPDNGTPYIAYKDEANSDGTTVMKFNGSQWVVVGTKSFTFNSFHQDLVFSDASHVPYVAYGYSNKGAVEKFNGNQWVKVGGSSFSAGAIGNVALSFKPSTDTPYVAYSDVANSGGLTVKKYNGNQWVVVGTKSFNTWTAFNPDIAFNPTTNTPYVAFRDGNTGPVIVKKFDGTQWTDAGSSKLSTGSSDAPSIAFHPSNHQPYVAYEKGHNKVKKLSGNQWVDIGNKFGSDELPDIGFQPSTEEVMVAINDGNGATLKKFNGLQWTTVGIDSFSEGGIRYVSLAFHPFTNSPYVGYMDGANGNRTTVMKYDCNSPNASFGTSTNNLTVDFLNSTSNAYNWEWSFGDGNVSTMENPSHTYDSSGNYQVCLIASNNCYSDTTCNILTVTCTAPSAEFTASTDTLFASFTNNSTNATNYQWYFGDGDTTSKVNPSHLYDTSGTYQVCLQVLNSCGSDSSCQQIKVNDQVTGVLNGQNMADEPINVSPNPFAGKTNINYELSQNGKAFLTIYDINGQLVKSSVHKTKSGNTQSIKVDFTDQSRGVYLYKLRINERLKTGKLVVH